MAFRPDEQKRLMVEPGGGHRATGPDGGEAADIAPGRALGIARAHDHFFHIAGLDLGAGDGVLDGVPAHGCAVGVVEPAADGFGEARAGVGDDDGVAHGGFLSVSLKVWNGGYGLVRNLVAARAVG